MKPIQVIINSLKKCDIDRPDSRVLSHIAKSPYLLDLASVNTNFAHDVYRDVSTATGTETKSVISSVAGFRINGPVFEEFPFYF